MLYHLISCLIEITNSKKIQDRSFKSCNFFLRIKNMLSWMNSYWSKNVRNIKIWVWISSILQPFQDISNPFIFPSSRYTNLNFLCRDGSDADSIRSIIGDENVPHISPGMTLIDRNNLSCSCRLKRRKLFHWFMWKRMHELPGRRGVAMIRNISV